MDPDLRLAQRGDARGSTKKGLDDRRGTKDTKRGPARDSGATRGATRGGRGERNARDGRDEAEEEKEEAPWYPPGGGKGALCCSPGGALLSPSCHEGSVLKVNATPGCTSPALTGRRLTALCLALLWTTLTLTAAAIGSFAGGNRYVPPHTDELDTDHSHRVEHKDGRYIRDPEGVHHGSGANFDVATYRHDASRELQTQADLEEDARRRKIRQQKMEERKAKEGTAGRGKGGLGKQGGSRGQQQPQQRAGAAAAQEETEAAGDEAWLDEPSRLDPESQIEWDESYRGTSPVHDDALDQARYGGYGVAHGEEPGGGKLTRGQELEYGGRNLSRPRRVEGEPGPRSPSSRGSRLLPAPGEAVAEETVPGVPGLMIAIHSGHSSQVRLALSRLPNDPMPVEPGDDDDAQGSDLDLDSDSGDDDDRQRKTKRGKARGGKKPTPKQQAPSQASRGGGGGSSNLIIAQMSIYGNNH